MNSQLTFANNYRAVVIGSSGGIGRAFENLLDKDPLCGEVIGLSRIDGFDLTNENSIYSAAQEIGEAGPVHVVIDATGFLHDDIQQPEKSIQALEPQNIEKAFALNAAGPLLVLKHFHTLMPLRERSIFATLSARVGSIEDNRLGGWFSYRMSKAALNMGLKTAAIEIARKRKQAICVSLHPGTVATSLSDPFSKNRERFTPEQSAEKMLKVLDGLSSEDNGSFFAYDGSAIPW